MSRGRFVVALVVGLLLCAAAAEAQPAVTPVQHKTAGNIAGADLQYQGLESYAYASISPIELNGKLAYVVSWSTVKYVLWYRSQDVRGIAPATSIKSAGPNSISVNLDLNLLISVDVATETDCAGGHASCTTFRPASVPFVGSFEAFQGAVSNLYQTNGSRRSVTVDRYTTSIWTRSGEEVSQTANFTGTVGQLPVSPYRSNANAWMYRARGAGTLEILPTPPQ